MVKIIENSPHLVVIDPAMKRAEIDCFKGIEEMSPWGCSYHVPGLVDEKSLQSEADISQVKAVIVLGGSASLTDPLPWRLALEKWFEKCLDAKVPTLGICWGHQWIANLFGGRIDFAREDRVKCKGFREVEIEKRAAFSASSGQVVVSHAYMVAEAPAKTNVFVRSELENEGFEYEDYPIYSFQAHPEATADFLVGNEIPRENHPSLEYGNGLVQEFLNWTQARQV